MTAMQSAETTAAKPWDGRIRTSYGILFFYYTFRIFGPRLAYAMLYPAVLYYQFFALKGKRASNDYLRRRFPGIGGFRLWRMRYRHFLSFGRMLVDRAYAFLGLLKKVRIERDGEGVIPGALADGKGLILMSAHLGNWELAAYCLGAYTVNGVPVPVNAVMYKGDGERVQRQLKRASGEPPFRVIASNDSLQASIEAKDALQRGEIVAIHGDRTLGAGGVKARLLGAEATFPAGAFVLAATTGAPVVFTFANRLGTRHYKLRARGPFHFQYTSRAERDANLSQWAQQFADELEAVMQEHPLQWFNFYPFWEQV